MLLGTLEKFRFVGSIGVVGMMKCVHGGIHIVVLVSVFCTLPGMSDQLEKEKNNVHTRKYR